MQSFTSASTGTFTLCGNQESEWNDMYLAPRDGTVIEIRCDNGVAPWYDLFKWTDEYKADDQYGETHTFKSIPSWRAVNDPRKGVADEQYLKWRPYNGNSQSYVDPTNGAQNTNEYWLKACGIK